MNSSQGNSQEVGIPEVLLTGTTDKQRWKMFLNYMTHNLGISKEEVEIMLDRAINHRANNIYSDDQIEDDINRIITVRVNHALKKICIEDQITNLVYDALMAQIKRIVRNKVFITLGEETLVLENEEN